MQMSQSAKLSRFLRNLSADDYDTRIRPTVDGTLPGLVQALSSFQ